ncbi:MAG: hypothetical protein ACKVTZ_10310 [Bacteroidia bacterium]
MGSFSQFNTLEDSLKHFQVAQEIKLIFPNVLAEKLVPPTLVEEITFNMTEIPYNISEAAICEMVIFPVIKSVWTNFRSKLLLWSHRSIGKGKITELAGIPDYIIAKRSPLGRGVMDLPMLVMIEAKKDDFDAGWGQCLAQMVTAQQMNKTEQRVYGIVSNGDNWQFGYFVDNKLITNTFSMGINEIQKLYNAIYFIFEECEKQV